MMKSEEGSASRVLENDGFVVVGRVTLKAPSEFLVHFDLPEAERWAPAINAFRIGGEVVRIGRSQHLNERIRQWNKDVSRALAGEFRKGGTNPFEAFEWRRRLTEQSQGEFLAQVGPTDKRLLASLERKLIIHYDPCLCNDSACGRARQQIERSVKNPVKSKTHWDLLNHSSGNCHRNCH